MGVVNESAYFFLGSPACIDLVDRDLPPRLALFLRDDLAIISFSSIDNYLFIRLIRTDVARTTFVQLYRQVHIAVKMIYLKIKPLQVIFVQF